MCNCVFEDKCLNEGQECDFCQYNADAVLQDFFEWNGEGDEPTQEELDENIQG